MTSSLGDAFGRARPTGDAVARAHARERLASALFEDLREPVRMGRFVLLERLGEGGMGTVYGAYDPELDRRVALKLLHARAEEGGDRAYRQLLREARALARLSHPNVVPVHDVGVIDGRVFLVMEFVVGQTLRAWLAGGARTWREVLEAYVQAGRGLAAAHASGIVHRDFKPDNALIGDDGRVRVVDFGLARRRAPADDAGDAGDGADADSTAVAGDGESGESAGDAGDGPNGEGGESAENVGGARALALADTQAPAPATPVPAAIETPARAPARRGAHTATAATASAVGVLVGTPRYMAPEQFEGAAVGPAADQFAFCVALYEALCGQRPFAGDTLPALMDSVCAGRVREPPRDRRVPRGVHAALRVGLSARPEDRHRSMTALLAALTRELGRTRRRLVGAAVAAAGVAIAALGAVVIERDRAAAPRCDGGRGDLAAAWGPGARERVDRALRATGSAYADAVAPRALAGLGRYGDAWVQMRRDACVRHRRGEQSGALLDRRMRCLDGRLRALRSAVEVLEEIDARSLANAMQVVDSLPPIAWCADTDALAAEVPPPGDPARARRVDALRARLGRVKAMEDAGRYAEALAAAQAVVADAEALGYAPVVAESLLAQGRAAMMTRGVEFSASVEPLRRAAEVGLASKMGALAVEALARRLYVEGRLGDDRAAVRALAPIAEALSEQVADSALARPLLLNNLGTAHLAAGDRERARDYFERALGALARVTDPPVELVSVRRNLAMLTRDPDRRMRLLQEALDELERRLGAGHPWALDARLQYAHYTPDPERARAVLAPACELYERFHAERAESQIRCLYHLAFLTAERGVLAASPGDAALPPARAPTTSQADRARALAMLDRASALGQSENVNQDLAWDRLARGWALYYRGQHAAAVAAFEAVHDQFAGVPDKWWYGLRAAHARLGMGLSRWARGRGADAARDLEAAAEAFAALGDNNENVEYVQRLAVARAALAAIRAGAAALGPRGAVRASGVERQ